MGVSSWNVKPSIRTSVLLGELDRIYHKPRPQLGHIALEDYLNSRPHIDFDDETKSIRAESERLRRRIHLSIPHPRHTSPLHVFPYCGSLEKTPERPYHPMVDDILYMSYYSEPTARTIGRGHLACVTFAGGKGYPRRRNYYSDENRDIGEEIKTRSYYHNNFNKNYVDAMSLPTGYASFLLRLKPPETNETLTNLDKMHIIALAEERKRNIRKNKTDGDLTDPIPKSKWTKDISPVKESSKVLKKQLSKSKDEEVFVSKKVEEPKNEPPAEVKETVRTLLKQESITKPEPVEEPPIKSIEEIPVKEELEISKSEKKTKVKKSSLSRNSSIQESPKPVVDEIPKAEEKPPVEETLKPEEPKVEEPAVEDTASSEKETSEPIEVKTEEPAAVIEAEKVPEETIHEPELIPEIMEQKELEPSEKTSTAEVIESAPKPVETEPSEPEPASEAVEQKEDVQPAVEAETSIETPAEPALSEKVELEPAEIASQEAIQKEEIIETEALSVPSEVEEPVKTDEIPASETTESVPTEEAPKDKVAVEATKTSEIVETVSTEVVTSETAQEPVTTESSQDGTIVMEFQSTETTVITSTTITSSSEMNVSENIIEEVSHSNESTVQKDNEPEPLIEEPQSPEIITNQINSTEICEVLSDVPEES